MGGARSSYWASQKPLVLTTQRTGMRIGGACKMGLLWIGRPSKFVEPLYILFCNGRTHKSLTVSRRTNRINWLAYQGFSDSTWALSARY